MPVPQQLNHAKKNFSSHLDEPADSRYRISSETENPPGDSISGLTPTLWVGCLLVRKASSMERVIAYVDGYNLYYGLRQKG